MSIEDVDYLKQNSIRQNYLFVVDSRERDRAVYPTPSEYVVSFTTPFRNVVGFEVVDASIPRTMYNISGGDPLYPINNTLVFYIYDDSSAIDIAHVNPINYVTVTIEPGDYTIQSLIAQINNTNKLRMHVNNNATNPEAEIVIEAISNPPDTKSLVKFTCPYPFVLDMSQSSIAETLGFDTYTNVSSESKKAPIEQRYTSFVPSSAFNANPYKLYKSVDLDPSVVLGPTNTVYEGPMSIYTKVSLASHKVAQSFYVPTVGFLSGISAALYTPSADYETVSWSLYSNAADPLYPHIPKQPDTSVAISSGNIAIDYIDGRQSEGETPKIKLLPGIYWIVFSNPDPLTADISLFYHDVSLAQGISAKQLMLFSETAASSTWVANPYDTSDIPCIASLMISVSESYHTVIAPGIFSLVGERFVIVRCPEIEEHSYRSLSYSQNCLGLAKFFLGNVGYTESRHDFSKIPLREFHPIGKMNKMTLRFQTSSGLLYDFKGVNHSITFAIHYLEPTQKDVFTRSLLNPNYTGRFIQDVMAQGEDDSDDQDDEYNNEDYLDKYRAREHRHLPETVTQIDTDALRRFALEDDDDDDEN